MDRISPTIWRAVRPLHCRQFSLASRARRSCIPSNHAEMTANKAFIQPRRDECRSPITVAKRLYSTIYRSPFPEPALPQPTSLFHFHFPTTGLDPSRAALPAYTDALTGQTLTQGEVRSMSLRMGYGIKKVPELIKGDVALIFSPNSLEYAVAFFACQAAGLVVTPASASYTPHELAYHIKDSTAKIAFVHPDLMETFEKAQQVVEQENGSQKGLDVFQLTPDSAGDVQDEGKGGRSFWTLMATEDEVGDWRGEELGPREEHNAAVLCYSSGTTGLPKGVETTHWNLTTMQTVFSVAMEKLCPEEQDKALALLPFSHIFGLVLVLLHPLTMRIPIIVLPKFTPHTFFTTIQTHKVTWSFVVPPLVSLLANFSGVAKYDLSSLRGLLSGAAPMSPDVARAAMDRLSESTGKEFMITQGYGLTETSPATHVLTLKDARRKLGSIGQLLPSLEAKIVQPDGSEAPTGTPGELLLKGPTVMKGYWRNESATEGSFTADKWLKTGDVVKVDEEGFWYIVDRLKEMIKVKGLQVAPAELEALLLSHPHIVDAGVIATKDAEDNELPRAFVVPRPSVLSDIVASSEAMAEYTQEIDNWIKERVSRHKQLRGGIIPVEAIPRSGSGKILRRQLATLKPLEVVMP
ncbi:putative AMP binding protein [Filobasidium floriforme]|uniref:putative AMP binding protein n=1 Tax=Filobasidium floriforme TaxID=5210 RepID=UPI001E8E0FFD|nr:putative AMP binding protein [Filobasidium floriforme]KAH8079661.1 putative AMP binding protein [Filobasidium floriforme]